MTNTFIDDENNGEKYFVDEDGRFVYNTAFKFNDEQSVDDMCRDAWHFIQTRTAER